MKRRSPDASRVFGISSNPDIKSAGSTRHAMKRQRVSAYHHEGNTF
jgi:hypothetical protein